jgi:uncharacterized phage protein gp47/JayE
MPLEVRTYDETVELARALLRGNIPGADVTPGSDYDAKARMLAALVTGNQGQAEYLAKQIFAASADGDHLDRHKRARLLPELGPAKAVGVVQLTATSGTPTQPVGSVLTHVSGTTYKTTRAVTLQAPVWTGKSVVAGSGISRVLVAPNITGIDAGHVVNIDGDLRLVQGTDAVVGFIDLWEPLSKVPTPGTPIEAAIGAGVTVLADETKAAGNKLQGDVLALSAPVGDISTSARIVGLSGGAGAETPEELRARVLAHDQQPPGNGNAGEYRARARTVKAYRIADACIYPGFRGLGTTDIIPLGPSGARRATLPQLDAVRAAIAAAPYVDDARVLAHTLTDYCEVHLAIEHEVGFEPDWTGSFAIVAGSTASVLTLGANPEGTIEQGDRIMIQQRVGAVWVTYEREVDEVLPYGLMLAEPLPHTPTANPDLRDDVYPGSANAAAIYAATDGVFDRLGPGHGSLAVPPRYERFPLPSVEWDPVLRISNLISAAKAVGGVRDVHLLSMNDVDPDDITPAAQEMVRAGQIRVTFVSPD